MSVFDLGDAEAFFESIERVFDRYRRGPARSTEDLLYVVMGLNHLREWISPNFNPDRSGKWPNIKDEEDKFSKSAYCDEGYETIRAICNSTKHGKTKRSTKTQYGLSFDDWPDVDSVADFDSGPPSGHCVDGESVETIIEPVLRLYRNWFRQPPA